MTSQRLSADLLRQAAHLTQQAADALEAGDVAAAMTLSERAEGFRADAMAVTTVRHSSESRKSASASVQARGRADRDVVVDVLGELDAIAPPRLIADYGAARFGHELSPSGFSALRRNEMRAYRSTGSTRTVFITPALDAGFLTAMRGQLALSSWPTWRRLVAPRTGRVELLRAAEAMVRQLRWVEETAPEAAADLRRLTGATVGSVPGATVAGGRLAALDVVSAAVAAELAELAPDDEGIRREQAERAERQLNVEELLWGSGAEVGRKRA